MENKECVCAKEEKSVNNYLKENMEIILEIRALTENIKQNIFGVESKEDKTFDPNCMLQVLDIQNYNLKRIIEDLINIKETINPKN